MQQPSIHHKITPWVIFLFLMLVCLPYFQASTAFADDSDPVTPPKVRMPPGVRIESPPTQPETKNEKKEKSWFSHNKWWVALGVVVLGGGVAAASGGGSSGGSESGDENGIYELEW